MQKRFQGKTQSELPKPNQPDELTRHKPAWRSDPADRVKSNLAAFAREAEKQKARISPAEEKAQLRLFSKEVAKPVLVPEKPVTQDVPAPDKLPVTNQTPQTIIKPVSSDSQGAESSLPESFGTQTDNQATADEMSLPDWIESGTAEKIANRVIQAEKDGHGMVSRLGSEIDAMSPGIDPFHFCGQLKSHKRWMTRISTMLLSVRFATPKLVLIRPIQSVEIL